ncbi:hypothetical protein G6F46_003975 [Rhizopus delemar]|uniref:Ubiquitin-conjugating enzyme E2 6 n=2 Tax=Rhizopus TaxID=4842 RepID=A0A9P7CS36_9FUNG|nr:hypothetical protein G6F55_003347 [Rhizopus delemar]KAG1547568.1 hypothetical protein G6F51_004187 [Rhizopus arrhizus]KAG1500908.1 hypothetical protein G6F54_003395 [Rhizopus delemar]KAG1514521.1 hypothetical protein G6F53_003611 [Rhizopus delemar]KAG1520358.1 hypothetical protein G6F52_007740 [Rhizopus delemar]
MATKTAYKRLTKEYLAIQANPPPFITAKPLESNILEWHYVIQGPPDSPYAGGEYYGRLNFPAEYPYKPPSIRMITPSGRFQPDTRLCLTMSDFHPSLWNPSWSVSTILNGLLSFMVSEETTTGSIKTSTAEKKIYAAKAHLWNLRHQKFREVFPELCTVDLNKLPTVDNPPSSLTKRNTSKGVTAVTEQTESEQGQEQGITHTAVIHLNGLSPV